MTVMLISGFGAEHEAPGGKVTHRGVLFLLCNGHGHTQLVTRTKGV